MWQSVASGVEDALRSVFFSGANGISGGDSQTILYSTDSGTSWQISQSGFFGGGFPGAHMLSPTIGFVAGQNSIFQPLVQATTDGGASWDPHAFYFDKNENGATDVRFLDVNTGVVSEGSFLTAGARLQGPLTAARELPGPTRVVGPPPISTTFPSPATHCAGSQLATPARSYEPQTAADRRRHQRLQSHRR
jgi:photosystem II stability/assembly factor-like uncharacterized protein